MRHLITQQAISEIKTVFRSVEEHPNRYNQLKQLFREPMHYQLFAEPILQLEHKRIAWYTNTPGKATKFSDLDKAGQAKAKLLLRRQLNQLEKYISSNYHGSYQQEVYGFFEQCQEIPKEDSIYLIEDAGKSRVLLLEWGFVVNVFNPNRGILSRLIPKDKFPLFFKVRYDDGSLAKGQRIHFMWNKHPVRMTSNDEGMIAFGEVKIGDQVEAFTIESNEKQNIHHFECDIEKPICEIILKQTVDAQFSLVDHEGNAVAGKVVKFSHGVNIVELKSDENGEFILADLLDGTSVSAQIADPKFSQTYEVSLENYQFRMQLPVPDKPPEPEPRIVQFFDPKKEQINDLEVLAYPKPENKGDEPVWKANYKTDEEGKFVFEQEPEFGTIIQLDFKYKKRNYTKEFIYKEDENYYPIHIKKRYNWWWLLLLLLPLLLLIRCEKDVPVKVMDTVVGSHVSNAQVDLRYQKSYLMDGFSFFTTDTVREKEQTDTGGKATFKDLKYSMYSSIFKRSSIAQFKVSASEDCYEKVRILDTLYHSLGDGDTVILKLQPKVLSLDIKVVDLEDLEPIPTADVVLEVEFNDKLYSLSAKTQPDGRVVFDNVPKCGRLKKVRGIAEGYFPDSLMNKPILDVWAGAIDSTRLLKLKPIKEQIIFWVVDCKTKKGLSGAEVKVRLDINGKIIEQTVKTNINGEGKGTYEDAHIIADLMLEASFAPYYKPGKLPKSHKVKDFIKLPKEERTICLEPLPNPMVFLNTDSLTKKPLAGVKNQILITKADNTSSTATISSNAQGEFTVVFEPGDKISILAQYPPDYESDSTKIKNKDGIQLKEGSQADRTIPLMPKLVNVEFRTTDEQKVNSVPNADLEYTITIDDIAVTLNGNPTQSGSDGKFVAKLPQIGKVSIEASKSGYGINNTTIQNRLVKQLMVAAATDRDIPLKKSQYVLSIINRNKAYDEIFAVIVNGKKLGEVHHDMAGYKETSFNLSISGTSSVRIELKYLGEGKNTSNEQNTGSVIEVKDKGSGRKSEVVYNGDDQDYHFTFDPGSFKLSKR